MLERFFIHLVKFQALSIFDGVSIEFAYTFLCYVATLGDYGEAMSTASQMGLGNDKGSLVAMPPIRRGPFVDPTIKNFNLRVCSRTIYKES